MRRSKKKKLSKQGKMLFSILIISIVLISLIFLPNKSNLSYEIHEIEEKANYTLKIDYPNITNNKIATKVNEYITNKKEEFLAVTEDLKSVTETKCDLSVTYTIKDLFNFKYLTINVYDYVGGAHYNREVKAYYYDDKTGKEVNIQEFLENDKLLDLSKIAYNYVLNYYKSNDKDYDEEWINKGTEAKLENYSFFDITPEGLLLTFLPYQVGPYSDGEINIVIPINELKNIIKNNYLPEEESKIDINEPIKRDLNKFKDKKLLAFTFDDGPSDIPTNKLLDNLNKYDARVTFFVLGSRVNTYNKTLKRAYEMGNTIGSHTYSHLNLYQLSDSAIIKEINSTSDAIESIIGIRPDKLRAPYGNTNNHIKELSDMYTILWNVDTEDWKYKDVEKIKNHIVSHAHDGAIILLHDIYNTSVEGALLAMEELKNEYAFVSIDEMIELKGINLDKNKTYFNF